MDDKTTVIYEAKTKNVIAIGYNDAWVLPVAAEVIIYSGNEQIFENMADGHIRLKDNAFIENSSK